MFNDLMDTIGFVTGRDEAVGEAMQKEFARQQRNIELIASENIVSPAVMAAMGTCAHQQICGGISWKALLWRLPMRGRRREHRPGERVNCSAPSMPTYSLTPVRRPNLAVYFALLQPGDTVMGMNLAEGGHLTHGSPVNMSGALYHFVAYGVDPETGCIDYDKLMEQAMEVKPKMIVAGASAYPRAIDFKKFREICDACGAYLMVDMAHIAGLVASGCHQNPVPLCGSGHHHHPQDAARSPGRHDSLPGRICQADRQGHFPRYPGAAR